MGELRITGLVAGYGGTPVINGLNCAFPLGRLSCILGVNGAGKSTLLRALSGYIKPTAGQAMLREHDLLRLPPLHRAQHIAVVPQLTLDGIPLTVREAVCIARYPRLNGQRRSAEIDTAVDAALEHLSVMHLADNHCGELSGGELRRVLIAQGLAQGADVLLLDEPTAFLDPPARYGILRHLRALASDSNRKLTVIAVLHDPELARQFADHALLLRDGRAQAEGPPEQVLDTQHLLTLYGQTEPWWTPEDQSCARS